MEKEAQSLLTEREDSSSSSGHDYSETSRATSFDSPPPKEMNFNLRRSPLSLLASRRRLFLFPGIAFLCTLLLVHIIRSQAAASQLHGMVRALTTGENVHLPFFKPLYEAEIAGPAMFPVEVAKGLPEDMCQLCDCHAIPAYYNPNENFQATFHRRPQAHEIYHPDGSIDVNEIVRQTILDAYCARQHLTVAQASKLLRRSRNLGDVMAWSLNKLALHRPTIYLTTATSPNGKLGEFRPQYFRRNGRAIRSWMSNSKESRFNADGEHPDGWQAVWIVAEDEVEIDPAVLHTLRRTGVPFIYFAYGLTKSWGNAQKNAVLELVHALSPGAHPGPGVYGHGPVYGLDDDNKAHPDLLNILINLKRFGAFDVGNLGPGWEGPTFDEETGEVSGTNSPFIRKFALDYGGFAYNSSILGTIISGPSFWKWTEWGGENEFVATIIDDVRDIEALCPRDEVCHYVWHNEPLTEIQKMTDDEEVAYVRKNGAKKLFSELGFDNVKPA